MRHLIAPSSMLEVAPTSIEEMRHLIAPSSMLEVAPTSIDSSSQKGMRTHYQSLSRSRRDTPSVGAIQPSRRERPNAYSCPRPWKNAS
jgi:hypothetical protein